MMNAAIERQKYATIPILVFVSSSTAKIQEFYTLRSWRYSWGFDWYVLEEINPQRHVWTSMICKIMKRSYRIRLFHERSWTLVGKSPAFWITSTSVGTPWSKSDNRMKKKYFKLCERSRCRTKLYEQRSYPFRFQRAAAAVALCSCDSFIFPVHSSSPFSQ